MVKMAEEPVLHITKWTLQRWKLCLTSLLKDKGTQLKIAAYLNDFFVFYCALTLNAKEALIPFFDISKNFSLRCICFQNACMQFNECPLLAFFCLAVLPFSSSTLGTDVQPCVVYFSENPRLPG